jgi:hypothetical protein
LTAAINAVNGDLSGLPQTISFHIPPEAGEVHYIQTPLDAYPLITNNNITIDGYTQGGASPNTHPIHAPNNATLKIVLTSTNGNAGSMLTMVTIATGSDYPNLGFGDSEMPILGIFRGTNVWIKGLCFQASPTTTSSYYAGGDCKTICIAPDAPDVSNLRCQGFHVSGCWFGIDPVTKQVAYMPDGVTVATPTICIANYSTGTNGIQPGVIPNISNDPGFYTCGVAAGSATPRAEFNVFVTGYGYDSTGGPHRLSGNFWGVLPDGVTLGDISVLDGGTQEGDAFMEFGSSTDILIGTDGDGVNDADEGNLFGSYANGGVDIYYYGGQGKTVIAGNTFGVDINGNSFNVGQSSLLVHHFNHDATCEVRFGSDFNGVSDALEANTVADAVLFDNDTASAGTQSHWVLMRGNSLTNTVTPNGSRPPLGDGQTAADGQNLYTNFIDVSGPNGTLDIIPVIGGTTTASTLMGTCGKPVSAPFNQLTVDLYESDPAGDAAGNPQGKTWRAAFVDNSAADANPAVGAFTFDISALGLSGKKVTLTVTYAEGIVITSISRAAGTTTLHYPLGNYSVQSATNPNGPWTFVQLASGTSTVIPDANPLKLYRLVSTIGSAGGQTSPFAVSFLIP